VIYIQALIGVWILGKLMRKIFFGQLRTTEFEVCVTIQCVVVVDLSVFYLALDGTVLVCHH